MRYATSLAALALLIGANSYSVTIYMLDDAQLSGQGNHCRGTIRGSCTGIASGVCCGGDDINDAADFVALAPSRDQCPARGELIFLTAGASQGSGSGSCEVTVGRAAGCVTSTTQIQGAYWYASSVGRAEFDAQNHTCTGSQDFDEYIWTVDGVDYHAPAHLARTFIQAKDQEGFLAIATPAPALLKRDQPCV